MDLPRLNDARRIARLTMVLDELYHAKDSNCPFDMGEFEFDMCGGMRKPAQRYSLYRQLVYATRDLRAFVIRGRFPGAMSIARAKALYTFYDNRMHIDEHSDSEMKTKDFNRIVRLLTILQKFRNHLRGHNATLTHRHVYQCKQSLALSYEEFLLSGGKKKRKLDVLRFPVEQQLHYAVNDIERFVCRARFPPPCVVHKAWKSIHNLDIVPLSHFTDSKFSCSSHIDDSDEEDVDCIDGGKSYDDENVSSHDASDVEYSEDDDDIDECD